MPELPEVETIRRQLAPLRRGAQDRARSRSTTRAGRGRSRPHEVEDALRGPARRALGRRGKYLIWELEGDVHLAQHLRMTGTVLLDPDRAGAARVLRADRGHRPRRARRCSLASSTRAASAPASCCSAPTRSTPSSTRGSGVEPFDAELHGRAPAAMARGRPGADQGVPARPAQVAGVGNIYADEALFRAQIHPLRAAGTLTRAQCGAAARRRSCEALQAGIDARGASDRRLPPHRRRQGLLPGPLPRPPARGRAVPALRHDDREDRRGRPRHVRLRALPAAPARGAGAGASPRRAQARAAPRAGRPPRRPSSSVEAADQAVADDTCGKLIIPVFWTSSTRPAGSLVRLTSAKSTPRGSSSAFTRLQKEHGSVVYTVTSAITSESIAMRLRIL